LGGELVNRTSFSLLEGKPMMTEERGDGVGGARTLKKEIVCLGRFQSLERISKQEDAQRNEHPKEVQKLEKR